ncbi:MAG: sigma-70 family RNA polymerase sigma factor [Cyclobacteriaceae bacterium]
MNLNQIKASILADDNVAFRYLYTTYGDYCVDSLVKYRHCDEEDAQDLFIDAVLIFRDKILADQINSLSSLQSFLYKICENNYLARLKADKSKKQKVSDVEFYFYESDHTEEEADFNELLSKTAKQAFDKLGEKCKDIISYFYIDKLRMDEIAELMGFSSANVAKTTKSRCYKQLLAEARSMRDT